jgi:hypothetical protein
MKKLYKTSPNTKLKAYSAMALAFTAGATATNAAIVYNDIEDVTIEVGDMFDIDLDGDGTLDFLFRAASTTGSDGTWSFGSVFGNATSYTVGNSGNMVMGTVGAYYNYASALDAGDNIGPDSPWLSYPSYGNSGVLASNFYGVTYGNFPGAGEKFLGFRFVVGDNTHYGWMRVVADVDPVTMTILDYAYDGTPDTPIEAGAEESIAVNELEAGAVNIYSFGAMVNVVNNAGIENATATVFDITGKQITSVQLTNGLTQVDLSAYATGNYIININSNSGNTAKQVFIQ